MLYHYTRFVAAVTAFSVAPAIAGADAPRVVTDVTPVHGLVAQVMDGVGTPDLILPPGASPHGYAMRPSQVRALSNADVLIWVGPELTPWLETAVDGLGVDMTRVNLLQIEGVMRLPYRTSVLFAQQGAEKHDDHDGHAGHDHDAHDHEKHAEHDHDAHDHEEHAEHDHDAHDHEEHAEHDHDAHDHEEHAGHDHDAHAKEDEHAHEDHAGHDHDDHDHSGTDPHAWLDPGNASVWLGAIADALSAADPANAAAYAANAAAARADLSALDAELVGTLAPMQEQAFIVFHDAYQYFEAHYGLNSAGAVRLSDAASPGARSLSMLRSRAEEGDVVCLFSEPQFDPEMVKTVGEGAGLPVSVLDPVGAHIEPGPGFYAALMRDMATQIAGCQGDAS